MGLFTNLLKILLGGGGGSGSKTYKTKDGGEITRTPGDGRIFSNREKLSGGGQKTTSWTYPGKKK